MPELLFARGFSESLITFASIAPENIIEDCSRYRFRSVQTSKKKSMYRTTDGNRMRSWRTLNFDKDSIKPSKA